MRTKLAVFLFWLHQIALSLWLGGILVIGAVVAPAAFGSARQAGDTHSGTPLFDFAGNILATAFGRFNWLVLASGTVLLLAGIGSGLAAGVCRKRLTVWSVLTLAALGGAAFLTFALYPEMMANRASGNLEVFDQQHKLYSNGFSVQLVLLLGSAALSSWMHLDRKPHAANQTLGS